MKKTKKTAILTLIGVFFLVFLDQITKYLAVVKLKGQQAFALIPDVFEFHYLENESAAFSMDLISILHRIFNFSYFNENPDAFLKCKMMFFVILTLVVIAAIIWFYLYRIPSDRHFFWLNLMIAIFISGAIGNLIDRMIHNYVIDFFYFKLINFPIFNVADIYVTVAAIAVVVLGMFYYKEEDYELIFPSRKKKEK